MLSGETAAGEHPVEAVEAMAKIARRTEKNIDYTVRFHDGHFQIKNTIDAISHATCGMAIDIHASAIAVCSLSGKTVRMVSRFRAPCPILGVTTNEKTWHKLGLSWGVVPVMVERFNSTDVLFYVAAREAKKAFGLKAGDQIVITGGMTNGVSGNTNLIKVEMIGND